MQIEYGSYRWVTAELSAYTRQVVRGFNRVNEKFGVEKFQLPSFDKLRDGWILNNTPLSLARVNFEEYDLLVFGPHTSEERNESGVLRMYSPEITLVGEGIPRMSRGFRVAIEKELEELAKTYRLIEDKRMLGLSFPPGLYAVKAKLFLVGKGEKVPEGTGVEDGGGDVG